MINEIIINVTYIYISYTNNQNIVLTNKNIFWNIQNVTKIRESWMLSNYLNILSINLKGYLKYII